MESKVKAKRQADPDVSRIRAVKRAFENVVRARMAARGANERLHDAEESLDTLIDTAPEEQRAFLRYLAGKGMSV
jgi:hypothetical protein